MTLNLSETRQADRAKMVLLTTELVSKFGCTVSTRVLPRKRLVAITGPGGVSVNLAFAGGVSPANVFVLGWNLAPNSTRIFAPNFSPAVNTVHYHKATDVAYGFDDLLQILEQRLSAIKHGTAYQSEAASKQHVEMGKARYAEMVARSRQAQASEA